jgi:hypothetical protein
MFEGVGPADDKFVPLTDMSDQPPGVGKID